MKKILYLLLIVTVGCQTTKIKNEHYKVSPANAELGSIGEAKSRYNLDNDFNIHAIPVLESKIRLELQLLPFNKDINKVYAAKVAAGQARVKINYVDSIPAKPVYATLNIISLTDFATELNGVHNKNVIAYLKDTKNAVMVTGVAIAFTDDDIAKIKQADTYYLINNLDKKYSVALYKEGKKTGIIDLQSGTLLAYNLSKFCWAINDRQQWYVGDIVKDNTSCKGNTKSRIKEKEEINLFKM